MHTLAVTYGNEVHLWQIGNPTPDELYELAARARITVAVPAGADHRVHVSPGEPHPHLLARATVHNVADLAAIAPERVDAYRAAEAEAVRQARLDAAHAAVNDLPEADKTTLRSRLGWTAAPRTDSTGRS